jgi:two-component system LytT family sensor kinase
MLYIFMRENIIVTAYDFIFSDKIKHRIVRHLVFWGIYCFIFFIQSIPVTGSKDLLSSRPLQIGFTRLLCFIPACILSVYFFIYVLWPVFLKRKRYAAFVFALISFIAFLIWINYYFALLFNFYTSSENYFPFGTILSFDINDNTTLAVIIGILVLGFKLAKHWYLQQQANLILARQKTKTEFRLLKGRLHPDFLFASLTNLYSRINRGSTDAATMILKLSDILSYILYDCDDELVPLEKELLMIQDFIAFEQMKQPKLLTIHTQINGDCGDLYISPLILLPFLQDSFTQALQNESSPSIIYIHISVINNELKFTLSNHQNAGEETGKIEWQKTIQNTRDRLNASYLNSYLLEITENEQSITLALKIKLQSNISVAGELLQKREAGIYETI